LGEQADVVVRLGFYSAAQNRRQDRGKFVSGHVGSILKTGVRSKMVVILNGESAHSS
jgi:hypothetical protein